MIWKCAKYLPEQDECRIVYDFKLRFCNPVHQVLTISTSAGIVVEKKRLPKIIESFRRSSVKFHPRRRRKIIEIHQIENDSWQSCKGFSGPLSILRRIRYLLDYLKNANNEINCEARAQGH